MVNPLVLKRAAFGNQLHGVRHHWELPHILKKMDQLSVSRYCRLLMPEAKCRMAYAASGRLPEIYSKIPTHFANKPAFKLRRAIPLQSTIWAMGTVISRSFPQCNQMIAW